MSEEDRGYELKVLKMMLNKYLDETVSVTEEGLRSLEANCDRVVWELATKIYSQSGHKVELCTARDVVNSRTGVMKFQLAQARQVAAEQEARRIAREEACQAAEQEVRRVAREEEACQAAEQEARRVEQEARLRAQQNKVACVLGVSGEDEGKAKVFVRVRKILSEELGVDENAVNLDSHIVNDLGANSVDGLVMALEEEFDIEITDDEDSDRLNLSSYYASSWSWFFSGSHSDSDWIVTACKVKEVVDFIYEKLSD